MKTVLAVLAVAWLGLAVGCVSATARLGRVQNGMSRNQVVELLGQPDSATLRGDVEYLTYYLTERPGSREQAYMVRLVGTRVESVGRFVRFGEIGVAGRSRSRVGGIGVILSPAEFPDVATQLRQLQALKNNGELSEEEFARAREELFAANP